MSEAEDAAFLEELRGDFLTEAGFLLEQCEESFLKLENPELRVEELGKIFRMAHSFKGAGASVGFTDLAEFAHKVEDCLALLRAHPHLVDSETISLLLECGDTFKLRVQCLKAKDNSPWDPTELKNKVVQRIQWLQEKTKVILSDEITPDQVKLISEDMANATSERLASEEKPAEPAVQESVQHAKAAPQVVQMPQAPANKESTAKPQNTNQSIKVDVERIDLILDLVGELVVLRSQISSEAERLSISGKLVELVSLLDKTVRGLQDRTLGLRLTPLKTTFLKTQRVIRDLSAKLNKKVNFVMQGEETEIDRTMVDMLADPLLHMARNSLDHGIETLEKRTERGKPETGTITISAEQVGGRIEVRVSDDGAGLNRQRILNKAVEKGLIQAGRSPDSYSDSEVFQMIFAAGFSTAEQVTDVSGRGVGMDVVKTNIDKLKGSIDIRSTEGEGTTVTISLPLTTSITDGMIVESKNERFILPMDSITELLHLNPEQFLHSPDGKRVVRHREALYEVSSVDELLYSRKQQSSSALLGVVVKLWSKSGAQKLYCLTVDRVLGQAQVVLKPLEKGMTTKAGVSGAAIMGDGQVALVLDPSNLLMVA